MIKLSGDFLSLAKLLAFEVSLMATRLWETLKGVESRLLEDHKAAD